MDINVLEEAGLSATEAKVYLALLELGSAMAGEITKKAEVNRTNAYDALERLSKKGLVTYVISANRKVFEPLPPERLYKLAKEKEERIKSLLPELNLRFKETKSKEDATIFKGKKGIKSAYESLLKERKEILVYGAESRFADMLPAYYIEWHKQRVKEGIALKIMFNEKVRERKIRERLKLAKLKFLPAAYDFPSTVLVSGEITITVVWTAMPFAFLIRSKDAVKSQTNFFEIMWKAAKN